jgi:prefoldin subunit 5
MPLNAPQEVQAPAAPGQVVVKPGVDAPQAVYRAFNEQRRELAQQLENLEDKRRGLQNQLQDPQVSGVNKAGLETRIAEVDKRIADVDKQLADADKAVAAQAAVPGAVPPPEPHRDRPGPPEEVFVLGGIFMFVVLFPLTIAYARRLWKRGAGAVVAFPQELADRLNRLDQAMDSIAIEVERIGEGQRFVTRVMSENGRSVGAGAAQPVSIGTHSEKAKVLREGERGER